MSNKESLEGHKSRSNSSKSLATFSSWGCLTTWLMSKNGTHFSSSKILLLLLLQATPNKTILNWFFYFFCLFFCQNNYYSTSCFFFLLLLKVPLRLAARAWMVLPSSQVCCTDSGGHLSLSLSLSCSQVNRIGQGLESTTQAPLVWFSFPLWAQRIFYFNVISKAWAWKKQFIFLVEPPRNLMPKGGSTMFTVNKLNNFPDPVRLDWINGLNGLMMTLPGKWRQNHVQVPGQLWNWQLPSKYEPSSTLIDLVIVREPAFASLKAAVPLWCPYDVAP